MTGNNRVFCDLCFTENEYDDKYCKECGERLPEKEIKIKNEIVDRKRLKIKSKFSNSINSFVYENDNKQFTYEVVNKIIFFDLLKIIGIFIIALYFIIFSYAILFSLKISSQYQIITMMPILVWCSIFIIISLIMAQFMVNRSIKLIIKSNFFNNHDTIGVIKVTGLMQRHWIFFDSNQNKLYSMIFSSRKKGSLYGIKENFKFSIFSKGSLMAQAITHDRTLLINVRSDQKLKRSVKKIFFGRKSFTIDANKVIDDSLILFFAFVLFRRKVFFN